MRSQFTPENRGALVERTAAGVSLPDACRDVGLRLSTVKTWLTRGRKEDGPYSDFVLAIENARQAAADRPRPMTGIELRRRVSESARGGSVAAMKLMWEMLRADSAPGDDEKPTPFDALDDDTEEGVTARV